MYIRCIRLLYFDKNIWVDFTSSSEVSFTSSIYLLIQNSVKQHYIIHSIRHTQYKLMYNYPILCSLKKLSSVQISVNVIVLM